MIAQGAHAQLPDARRIAEPSTPATPLRRLGDRLGVDLWVKREDLYPSLAGGNKARKMDRLLPSLEARGIDAVVTTGSTSSNHARVVALAAAQRGWRCSLVLHGYPRDLDRTLNGHLLRNSGADLTFVAPDAISKTLDRAVQRLDAQGHVPALIPGGGHTVEGALAYVDVLREIDQQRPPPDLSRETAVVVTPCGTGATQAGLHVGSELLGGYRVVGISIARPHEAATAAVAESCAEARRHLDVTATLAFEVYDRWTEGGYARSSPRVEATTRLTLVQEGLVLDPTYTGKAFLGLVELVRSGEIPSGSQVWFVQTGGWSTVDPRGAGDG